MPWCYKCGLGPKATAEMRRTSKITTHPLTGKPAEISYICRDRVECQKRAKAGSTSKGRGSGDSKPGTSRAGSRRKKSRSGS